MLVREEGEKVEGQPGDKPGVGKILEINEELIQKHLSEMVRGSVEDTLNTLLDAEADGLCGASRRARTHI